jgi:uncharacterized protein (DUF58 family)
MVFSEWLVIVFMVPLLFLLFGSVLSFYSERIDIEVIRDLSNVKIFEHDKIEVSLKLKNNGVNLSFLELYDKLPGKVKVLNGSNYSVISLKKGEEITFKYEITCPLRGRFQIGPLFFRARDYFGMFFKEAVVETESFITVIPQIEEIRDIEVKAKANIFPGIMQTKHSGIGTEFFGIREYTSGDTFKRINWKTFARFNNPMVNEYELESTTDVILIVDARSIQGFGTLRHNPMEYSVKAATAITSHFLKRRDRVGLIAYGRPDGHLQWVYPESGKKQLYKIVEEIVALEPIGEFPLSGVLYEAVTHMLPKKALIIFISSLEGDWTIPKTIEDLVSRGFNVIVLSPSPVDIEFSLQIADVNSLLAHKILSFERKIFLSQIRNTGARVVDWNPTLPLAVSLKEVEKYQIRR